MSKERERKNDLWITLSLLDSHGGEINALLRI